MEDMKACFIGHFSSDQSLGGAVSAAGNQVQRKIFSEVSSLFGSRLSSCYSMIPVPSWPKGPLITTMLLEDRVIFPGFINIAILKHLIFAFRLFIHLVRERPQFCLQYNSYLFENFSLLLYKFLFKDVRLGLIIQDIHVRLSSSMFSKVGIRYIFENASLKLARLFDCIAPVSKVIADDFNFDINKCHIFQGGITDFALRLTHSVNDLSDIAVFAGALEPHNGIDLLTNEWISQQVPYQLHIFGKGSLAACIQSLSRTNSHIIYHGFHAEDVIVEWQRKARWNFCLRYSIGLNEKYFFPSKLFNLLLSPGVVLVNDFYGLPDNLRSNVCVLKNNITNLSEMLVSSLNHYNINDVAKRRDMLISEYSWRACVCKLADWPLENRS